MSLWAIVPVKPLSFGKSRLSDVLSEEDRFSLNTRLYQNTLNILRNVKEISDILVVSRDTGVLAYARELGVRTVQENGSPDLNAALRRAAIFSQMFGSSSVLTVPADLPLLQVGDIEKVIDQADKSPHAVIVPDRRREGTNTLLITPPDLIPFSFGINSFSAHCHLIEQAGAKLTIVTNENIELDLDLPEDLLFLENNYKISITQDFGHKDHLAA